MTPTEWIWWSVFIGLVLTAIWWQEWEERQENKKDEEFDDEVAYSSWLEEKLYYTGESQRKSWEESLLKYRRRLWAEYYAESGDY